MSLSQGSELHRAVVDESLNTGGTTADVRQLQAQEDREIVAVSFSKNSSEGFLELSFSSASEIGGSQNQTESRSSAIAIFGGSAQNTTVVEGINWGEGEEIHLHEKNNTGAGIDYSLVVYYREV